VINGEKQIWEVLKHVFDPEMPSISVIDLGMIEAVTLTGSHVRIEVLPTFTGCPALEMIAKNIANTVTKMAEGLDVDVQFIYDPIWTSNRITREGRNRLKQFGIAPPPDSFEEIWSIHCPYCDSPYTEVDSIFGPTACRSLLYCKSCKNPFEAMKPISTMI